RDLGAQELRFRSRRLAQQRGARIERRVELIGIDLPLDQRRADARREIAARLLLERAAQVGGRLGGAAERALGERAAVEAFGGDLRIAGRGELAEAVDRILQPGAALRMVRLEARRRIEVEPVAQVERLQREWLALGVLDALRGLLVAGLDALQRLDMPAVR